MGSMRKAIFRNDQWEVTNCGVASLRAGAPYRYQIDAEQLLAIESFGDRQLYSWPLHVLRMVWVNPDLFFEGFKAAIDAHEGQYSGKVDLALLEASFDAAMRNDGHAAQPRHHHRPGSSRRSDTTLPEKTVRESRGRFQGTRGRRRRALERAESLSPN